MRIAINNDPSRIIEFNPQDPGFTEGVKGVYSAFRSKANALKARFNRGEIDDDTAQRETCTFCCGEIDQLFGPGTSEKAFRGAPTMSTVTQFLDGIYAYIHNAYVKPSAPRATNKPAMKSRKRHLRK